MALIDERLDRLERVLDALTKAWTGSGTQPATGVDTSSPFIRKMMDFAAGLEPSEQQSLGVILAAAAAAGKQVAQSPQNDQQRAASAFLLALDVKLASGGASVSTHAGTEVGPTITLTTVVTVAASHPWITC